MDSGLFYLHPRHDRSGLCPPTRLPVTSDQSPAASSIDAVRCAHHILHSR